MLNAIQGGFVEKMQRYEDYIKALEEERRKIQVFERELPLCMELVTQAIETCRHHLSGSSTEHNENAQSDSSEQISSDGPVFEEFIPLKRISSRTDLVEEQEPQVPGNLDGSDDKDDQSSKKPDWLRSVQLWNQTPDLPTNSKQNSHRKVAVFEVKRNGTGGAFHPFKKEKTPTAPAQEPAEEPAEDGVGVPAERDVVKKKKEEKNGHSSRKSRRCWSPELHRRFLQALERLGGSHVATPKQIRELMKLDGLTNDEVKSHLQKYRLHTRRPSSSTPVTVPQVQAPQFVVVGGIWVPPEYASQAAASVVSGEASGGGSACPEIYVPVATHPPSVQNPNQRLQSDYRSSDSGGEAQSHSSATSSSSMRLREITTSNSAGH